MTSAYLIGAYSTTFGRAPDRDHRALAREAVLGAIADAGLADGGSVGQAFFGCCLMHRTGQTMIRGQACLLGLVDDGVLPARMPVVNVEGACATGSLALHGAWMAVLAGAQDLVLAVGVEKMFEPSNPAGILGEIEGGFDRFDRPRWIDTYRRAAAEAGTTWSPAANRSIAMDTYGLQAAWHMHRHGTTQAQIAVAAAKNHCHGALNPKAQYRFRLTPDAVLADRPVSGPLTRAMCAPIGDGAAAALVCSESFLRSLPGRVRERAVRILSMGLSGGMFRDFDEPGLSRAAADRAYRAAGLGPDDIDLAEVHDATSFCEIYQAEMLRFCPEGAGGAYVASGATTLGGARPVNTSGGLVSKGHPIAATGLSMACEIALQLRGEAGERQVPRARIGLVENGGGVIGFEEAVCAVSILAGPGRD